MAIFEFHFHVKDLSDNAVIREIKNLKTTIMASFEEFRTALQEVTASLDNIAADITRLTDQLQNGNLTPEQEQQVFDELRAVADRARSIADATPETQEPSPDNGE